MTVAEVRIGTRGSRLALVQARLAGQAMAELGQPSRLVVIETEGDRRRPDTAWGEGAFVKAIESALIDGRIDLAVHSAKDVPTEEDERLLIAAYLPRADARDALVVAAGSSASLDDLSIGSRVGTDSPRRTGFVRARRPDLLVHPLHGNVDTRLRRLEAGETDALVVACAGLDRLGLGERIAQRLDPELVPPAPGQGALALQIRRGDARMLDVTRTLDHPATRAAVETERALLVAAGGGCRAPVGALAEVRGRELHLLAGRAEPDGGGAWTSRRSGSLDDAIAIVAELHRELWPPAVLEARA